MQRVGWQTWTMMFGVIAAVTVPAVGVGADTVFEPVGPVIRGHHVIDVDLSADGRRVAVADNDSHWWWYIDCNDLAARGPSRVRVFEEVDGRWVQLGDAIDGRRLADSASSIDIAMSDDGDRLVVGTTDGVGACSPGDVQVFDWDGTAWREAEDDDAFRTPDATDELGTAVAMSGDGGVIAFSSPVSPETIGGPASARVFRQVGDNWVQVGDDITTPDGDDFGAMIDIADDGERVVVGDFGVDLVYTFDWDGGRWVEVGAPTAITELWALQLSADGDTVVLGGEGGSVFEWTGGGWNRIGDAGGTISNDGTRIASPDQRGLLDRVGDAWVRLAGEIADVAELSGDGRRVAVRADPHGVCVVDVATAPLPGESACVGPGGAFDPPALVDAAPVAASETYCFETEFTVPGDHVVVNVTPVGAATRGNGAVHASDEPPPSTANVNFGPDTVDPNVAIVRVADDLRICFTNSMHGPVDIVVDQLAVAAAGAFRSPTTSGATRLADTRGLLAGPRLAASETRCLVVDDADPGEFVAVNLTPVDAVTNGFAVVHSSDDPPGATASANFAAGSVDPNLALVRVGIDERICVTNSRHGAVDVVLDLMAVAESDTFAVADPAGATRLVDTRSGTGFDRLAPLETSCVTPLGARPDDWVVVNVTPVEADRRGFGAVHADDDELIGAVAPDRPKADRFESANVNFSAGSIDPNLSVVPVGLFGEICFTNSVHGAVDVVIDQLLVGGAAVFSNRNASGGFRLTDTRESRYDQG